MKRIISIAIITLFATLSASAAMSNSRVRKEARFLTDKMAYELNLHTAQYDDVYEINYDFIASVRYILDDVARGYRWAREEYDDYLHLRNNELRNALSRTQYNRFLHMEHFRRPLYLDAGKWSFRVYLTYHDRNHFFFPKPHHYRSYKGKPNRPAPHRPEMNRPKPSPRPEMNHRPNNNRPNNWEKPGKPNNNPKPNISKPDNNLKPNISKPKRNDNNKPNVNRPNNKRNERTNLNRSNGNDKNKASTSKTTDKRRENKESKPQRSSGKRSS